jgi:2-polyprenyl-6-methoxyphenol hydroxylase-like FAD-dependent oxidoreductase
MRSEKQGDKTMSKRNVLIIGGGVAGPALALFLQRAGIEVSVYEAGEKADDQAGSFLNVASNGMRVLETLGLDGAVAQEGIACPQLMMWNGQGKLLGEVPNGLQPGEGPTSVTIKRGTLHKILHDEVIRQGISVEFGKKLQDVKVGKPDGTQAVRAIFRDGSYAEGDLLIGCDGIHARTRQIINPQAPLPSYTGLVSCGGYARLPVADLPNVPRSTQHLIFGKHAFFGYLIREDGEIYWFENLGYSGAPRRSELEAISDEEWKAKLLAMHQEDQPVIQAMIRATTSEIATYPIYDIPTQPIWHKGPICLIGDAAHATSPSAGQGASLALEDAIVLARCLRDLPGTHTAFHTFEQLRRERAEKIVKFSRERGANKVTSNALARWWRDMTLPFFLRHFAKGDAIRWIAEYEVAWDAPVA